jgi:hypothetical protein
VLVSPYAFNYDLTAVTAGLVWMLAGRLPLRPELGALYLLAWIAPAAMMYLNMAGIGVMPLALVALYGIVLREAASAPAGDRAPAGTAPLLTAGSPGAAPLH